ncbi:MAG: hypothetical protein ABIA63_09250 [bacterium]
MVNSKEISLICPFCDGKIILDSSTGEILHKEKAKKETESFKDFLEKRKSHTKTLSDKFTQAKEKERQRKDILEKKFKWAQEHKDELPDARPDIQWD